MNIEQEIKRIMEDRSHPAIEQAEWAKTYLVEHFVTHANMEAFKAAGFENLEWVQNLIDEPSHSWAIQWVAEEIAQLEGQ
jgi:hypothetical protein